MRVDEIFDLNYGHSLELNALTQSDSDGAVNLVSRTAKNNGVSARVEVPEGVVPGVPGSLTVALGGSVLETFIQPNPFVCGRDVMVLTPKNPSMGEVEKLWWAHCIRENRYRYSYGRQANRTLGSIELPDQVPEWLSSTGVPNVDSFKAAASVDPVTLPPAEQWSEFTLDAIFDIQRGVPLTQQKRVPGSTPYVSASARNNSVTDFVGQPPSHKAGTITLPYDGSVGHACYQPDDFYLGEKINAMIPREPIPILAALFVCKLIRHESERYGYGYKWNLARMGKDSIKLPSVLGLDSKPKPNWELIESYMESLPYSAGAI